MNIGINVFNTRRSSNKNFVPEVQMTSAMCVYVHLIQMTVIRCKEDTTVAENPAEEVGVHIIFRQLCFSSSSVSSNKMLQSISSPYLLKRYYFAAEVFPLRC
ncbi:hypothetical protein TNCT_20491 [Trichonephila clavata]|uniref:Uncharacterized protein n=1 Tax=Trichonephila clavata TaxID=2740835 RepID=A0A8X6HSB8_TRICU|nr:hypothetical protein TNCT_20491 [Trichonephila clavata]